MAAEDTSYYGTWKIVECVSLAGTVETTGIEGTEFQLDESYDVSWKVSEDAEPMPFFNCETYEVSPGNGGDPGNPATLKFFGTFAGHVIEFRVEVADDLMLLTYERCCMLQCQRISASDPRDDIPFSFLGALEEGYFADLVIRADTGKEFKAHSIILCLSAPDVEWSSSAMPLSGLSEDVLQTALYYLYTECLPRGMLESTAKACVKALGKSEGFSRFTDLCETFLQNTALKQQIISLVTDMHTCGDRIIELFSGKGENAVGMEDCLMSNPAKFCYMVKQGLREGAVACAKLLIVCDLFSRRKGELSREERHEIIKYAKSRLPVFMNQLHKFLELCRQHSASLTVLQRQDLAAYLVPELETSLDTVSKFAVGSKAALEQVIDSSSEKEKQEKGEKHRKGHVSDVLGKTLKNALHVRELKKLKSVHDRTTASFMHLMQKKENFALMTEGEKIRSVCKNLEQLIDEVPLFLTRIEELISTLDEKVTWREWKYLFKLGTSKIAWGLSKVLTNKQSLKSLINQACDIVSRDQFTASLVSVGLLSQDQKSDGATSQMNPKSMQPQTNYAQLSSVESLCISPYARDSVLAKRAVELLQKKEKTDVVFEIILVHDIGDVVIDHTTGEAIQRAETEREVEIHHIHAHCVIIAARCNWFRRALMSGMRESIDKKITVHDTNPELFQLFLEYLYSGQIDTNELSTEQLADVMALADRYEMDCVKSLCEQSLKHHMDEQTVLYLLSLADQLHAKTLKESTLNYLVDHPSVIDSEVFDDLPEHLQTEVEEVVSWRGLEPRSRNLSGHSHTETPSSVSSMSEVEELLNNVQLDQPDLSTSSSSDDLPCVEDSVQLEACLDALRHIVGDSVPRGELVRVALAADYDINRALNFFFSS
ncbi:hypothetical protein ScPMuIL_004997 [Solemya velum]